MLLIDVNQQAVMLTVTLHVLLLKYSCTRYSTGSDQGEGGGVSAFSGLECWTGVLDWSAGLECWTGVLDWSAGL